MIRLNHLNDTIMQKISQKQQKILAILLKEENLSSSKIHGKLQEMGDEQSLVTVKRTVSEMVKRGLLSVRGAGPATSYAISPLGRLGADVIAAAYCALEPDQRYGRGSFNFELFPAVPDDVFLDAELEKIKKATIEYHRRISDIPPAIQKKELERLVIELSWKSSKIEGNTYTLLDTEKLILEHKEAAGHSKAEALMILNHKSAFDFIYANKQAFKILSRRNLEELHALLVQDLSVGLGLRKKGVGVLGSKYKPLDNIHQITDVLEDLARAVERMQTPAAKALIALLGISYIQPFEDGNKRTSRLMANALLMAHGWAPLSYRSVDESEYREAMLVFYELNSLVPFKRLFIEQYDFAARTYAVK